MFKKVLFLFTIVLLAECHAQEPSKLYISGIPEFASGELISKSLRDKNGEVCAGLIIISDLKGLTYQAGLGIVKLNSSAGRDILFLSPGERIINVFCSGYQPMKIILSEHGIRLRSGEAWQIKITGDKKTDLIPLNIIPNMPGVKISIDGKIIEINKPQLVSAGEHQVRLQKDGYKTIQDSIIVSTNSNLFNYTLVEIDEVKVQIKSVPSGARILLGISDYGVTNNGFFLLPGKYKIKLSKAGYLDHEDSIDVDESKQNTFEYNLVRATGSLILHVDPSDATVLINKEDYNGNRAIDLSPGIYKVKIEKQGYNSLSEIIEIKLGETLTKNYQLIQELGGLQLSIQPLEAEVKLLQNGDVKYKWQGAGSYKDLPVGEYILECSLSGYKPMDKTIIIEENKTSKEEVQLEKEAGDLLEETEENSGISWYYYVGGAVLGSTAAILLFRNSNSNSSRPNLERTIQLPPDRP